MEKKQGENREKLEAVLCPVEKGNYTYILQCADESLYTGWTNNLTQRLKAHKDGRGGKYTRAHRPLELVYYEKSETSKEAARREWEWKQQSRGEKMERIRKGLCGGDFLHCRKINEEQLVDLYEIHLNRDFPDNERKPLAMLLDQMRKGNYHVWGFYRKAEMVAYALFQQRPGSNCILLDYYAVLPQYRAGGVGSQCFQHLHFLMKDYDMILIETENPMQAETEEERIIQIRRQNFYKRNGAVLFPLYVTVCGAPFQLMAVSCRERPGKQVCQTEMDLLYRSLFSKERYEKQVFWQ